MGTQLVLALMVQQLLFFSFQGKGELGEGTPSLIGLLGVFLNFMQFYCNFILEFYTSLFLNVIQTVN